MTRPAEEIEVIKELFPSRDTALRQLRRKSGVEVCIIGRTYEAVLLAQMLAFEGRKVLLAASTDFIAPGSLSVPSALASAGNLRSFKDLLRDSADLKLTAFHVVNTSDEMSFSGIKGWRRFFLTFFCRIHGLDAFFPARASVNMTRLLMERLVAARQEGAICLNYFKALEIRSKKNGGFLVCLTDNFGEPEKKAYEIESRIVIECSTEGQIRFLWSIGGEKPYDEVRDLDCVVPLGNPLGAVSFLSRKLRSMSAKLGWKSLTPVSGRPLPGVWNYPEIEKSFLACCQAASVPEKAAWLALSRFGSRVRYFMKQESMLELAGSGAMKGEEALARQMELAITDEDVARRLTAQLLP